MVVITVTRCGTHRRKKQCGVMQALAGVLLVAAGADAAAAQEAPPPSAIEHALVEYLCRTVHGPTMIGTQVYQSCYAEQLAALREPFGPDLANLTRADRRSLDAWCGKMQAAGDRDAYLACINRQLVRLKEERAAKAKPAGANEPDDLKETEAAAPLEAIAAVEPRPPVAQSSSGTPWLMLAIGGVVASAGGAAFVLLRNRRPPQQACRCGAAVDGAGDMCASCRHEAAEARRRAAAERAEEARLQVEQAKRGAERQDEEARREQERRDEAARLAAEAEQRRRDEQDRRLQQAARAAEAAGGAAQAAGGEDMFDPHAVLGVAPGADAEEIRAAYEQAKAKYDPREYEHLGVELQAHFKAKADAVERAFQMLYASE